MWSNTKSKINIIVYKSNSKLVLTEHLLLNRKCLIMLQVQVFNVQIE